MDPLPLNDLIKFFRHSIIRTFITAWFIWNWRIVLILLDLSMNSTEKINLISLYNEPYYTIIFPIFSTIAAIPVMMILVHIYNIFRGFFDTLDTMVLKKVQNIKDTHSQYYYRSSTALNITLLGYMSTVQKKLDILRDAIKTENNPAEIRNTVDDIINEIRATEGPNEIKNTVDEIINDIRAIQGLLGMTEQIIDYSRKQAGSVQYNFQDFKSEICEIYKIVIKREPVLEMKKATEELIADQDAYVQEVLSSQKQD